MERQRWGGTRFTRSVWRPTGLFLPLRGMPADNAQWLAPTGSTLWDTAICLLFPPTCEAPGVDVYVSPWRPLTSFCFLPVCAFFGRPGALLRCALFVRQTVSLLPALLSRVDQIKDEIYKKGKLVKEKTELTGMAPLHKACQYGRDSNVEKLLEEGADVKVKNHWGSNCLHWTVKGFVHEQGEDGFETNRKPKYMAIARLLFSTNRKLLDGVDCNGKTPLDLAKELEATDMVNWLEEKEEQVREAKREMQKKRDKNKPKVRRVGD